VSMGGGERSKIFGSRRREREIEDSGADHHSAGINTEAPQ